VAIVSAMVRPSLWKRIEPVVRTLLGLLLVY